MDAGLRERLVRAKVRDLDACRLGLPSVIASSRLDPKKNHFGLLQAFARSEELQNTANLCIVLRGIENPLRDYHGLTGTEGTAVYPGKNTAGVDRLPDLCTRTGWMYFL